MAERVRCSECGLPVEPGDVPTELCDCIPFRATCLMVVLGWILVMATACADGGRYLPDAGVDDRVSSARVALAQWEPTLKRGWEALERDCWRDAEEALQQLRRLEALINLGVPHVENDDPLRTWAGLVGRYGQVDHFRLAADRRAHSNGGCR
ncbi:MAG TPA: hypothetical protein VK539_03190 [Myxococcaceae bacterium]|nr:hypothetical protein [Myxococcaceae bacterium]